MRFIFSMINGSFKLGMRVAAKMVILPFRIGIALVIFCLTTPFILGGMMGFFGGAVSTFVLCDADRRQKFFTLLGF